jgi:hypothetical protein
LALNLGVPSFIPFGGIGYNLRSGKTAIALCVDRFVDLCDSFAAFGQSWQEIGVDVPQINHNRRTLPIPDSVKFMSGVSFREA